MVVFFCQNQYEYEQEKLTSLEGAPKEVSGKFNCNGNQLTTLEGGPKKVGNFYCNGNQLTSLKGAPEKVGSLFYCYGNKLTSVRGFPEDFEGGLYINHNPVFELFELFEENRIFSAVKVTKIAKLLNEYDVISLDGKKVYRNNLEEVFNVLGIEIPKDIKLENYEIH